MHCRGETSCGHGQSDEQSTAVRQGMSQLCHCAPEPVDVMCISGMNYAVLFCRQNQQM